MLVAALLLAGTVWVHRGDPRVVPDASYTPPASVPTEPGRLIRSRPMTTGVPDGLRAWLMLYTTTDGDGTPAVASGTVLAPATSDADGDLPVIAVGHGTTGVVPRCAPSLSEAPFADGASAALEQVVRSGRVAVMSDYVGLGTAGPHTYLVGPDAAHAVLDSVRAARELTEVTEVTEVTVGTQVVAWGHSQGGHAVLWTGMLAADYAPELDLRRRTVRGGHGPRQPCLPRAGPPLARRARLAAHRGARRVDGGALLGRTRRGGVPDLTDAGRTTRSGWRRSRAGQPR